MDTNIELFISLMDGIYWEGYAYELAKENPERYVHEYNEFMSAYK